MTMKSATITIAPVALAMGLLAAGSAVPAAKEKLDGTASQRAACTSDVFRYCVAAIPNREMIVSCLQHNSYRLNKDCRAVMDGKK
jgi:hypothetical protein